MSNPNKPQDPESESDVIVEEERPDIEEPGRFAVLLHNDHYTTMEFVIEVLQKFFKKNKDDAVALMLKVHNEGKAVAGVYSFEIAETKVAQVTEYARAKGFPLKVSVENI